MAKVCVLDSTQNEMVIAQKVKLEINFSSIFESTSEETLI